MDCLLHIGTFPIGDVVPCLGLGLVRLLSFGLTVNFEKVVNHGVSVQIIWSI